MMRLSWVTIILLRGKRMKVEFEVDDKIVMNHENIYEGVMSGVHVLSLFHADGTINGIAYISVQHMMDLLKEVFKDPDTRR